MYFVYVCACVSVRVHIHSMCKLQHEDLEIESLSNNKCGKGIKSLSCGTWLTGEANANSPCLTKG